MPPSFDENDNSSNGQNMVSNLPLLFAAGYPTSLEKITEKQLEKFVPFMVHCSCGNLQGTPNVMDEAEPEWWPADLKYLKPFRRPDDFNGDWHAKLKELVVMCYSHHKSIFLLRFCQQLSAYEQASLRFINNYNSTTSLYHRTSNKLLVTFRNENMMYDTQPTTQRKSLLPKSPSAHNLEIQQQMVETSLFDIYLCDNCDAELYSLNAYTEHEKVCSANVGGGDDDDDDDVILIDPDEECTVNSENIQAEFLANFGLIGSNSLPSQPSTSGRRRINYLDILSPEKQLRRLPSRSHAAASLSKNPTIPVSSPCGQLLMKQAKNMMTREYMVERLDRLERFCGAPPVVTDFPRFMQGKSRLPSANVTFKKPDDEYHYHNYKFPRRQFSTKQRRDNFNFLSSLMLKACKPVSVKVKRLSSTDIEIQKAKLKQAAQKLSFEVPQKRPHVVEFIDLCDSSDEDAPVTDKQLRIQTILPDNGLDEDMTNSSGRSEVDENMLRKLDGTLISMPVVASQIFPPQQFTTSPVQPLRTSMAQQLNNNNNNISQPLRSVTLFSNKVNQNGVASAPTYAFQQEQITTTTTAAIKDWCSSTTPTQQTARKSTSARAVRKMPALVNIQQYTTTTIRTTITAAAANIAT